MAGTSQKQRVFEMRTAKNNLDDIWDYVAKANPTMLGDIADVQRSRLREKDRPAGTCWACGRFAKGALIHESPGTAKCCKDCDAYKNT